MRDTPAPPFSRERMEELLVQFRAETARLRRLKFTMVALVPFMTVLALVFCRLPPLFILWMGVCILMIRSVYDQLTELHRQGKYIQQHIHNMDDPRDVVPLIDFLGMRNNQTYPVVRRTLIRLLPRMKASDEKLLNYEQRNRLYEVLMSEDEELALAVLATLEQVGNTNAIRYVEPLANSAWRAGDFPLSDISRVRRAAQDCLAFLREKQRKQQESHLLLRAAQAPDDASTMLLRPVQGVGSADPEQLLRPSLGGSFDSNCTQETPEGREN